MNAHAYPSVAFDTIDRAVLLNTLSNAVGVKDRCSLPTYNADNTRCRLPVSSQNHTS